MAVQVSDIAFAIFVDVCVQYYEVCTKCTCHHGGVTFMYVCFIVGEMLMALDENEKAIDMLRKGQSIYKAINADGLSGDTRSLSALTSALAQALCVGENFDEGKHMLSLRM